MMKRMQNNLIFLSLLFVFPSGLLAKEKLILKKIEHPTKVNRDVHITYTAHFPFEPGELWKILEKIERYRIVFPRFKEARVIRSYPRQDPLKQRQKIYIKVNLPWPVPDVWNHLFLDFDARIPKTLRWRRLRGSFRKNKGTIEISPNEYGCRLTLDIYANPGSGAPMWIVRWGIRNYLPNLIHSLFDTAKRQRKRARKSKVSS